MNNKLRQPVPASLIPIFIIALLCGIAIYLAELLSRDRIDLNRQMATIKMIEEVMPLTHNNNLYEDSIEIPGMSTTVYRARQNEEKVGLVFMPISAIGYNGRIKLAMGVSYDGTLTGVRIIEHQETSGLGDGIDQNISAWIYGFDNRSLANMANEAWAVTNDGGNFDQLSGATISPRGVINAVKSTLQYYELNRSDLYQ